MAAFHHGLVRMVGYSSFMRASRRAYVASALLASWTGTYLDLYFVGKGLYAFPKRPFPSVFSIDIFFTAVVLPLGTVFFLALMERLSRLGRMGLIAALSAHWRPHWRPKPRRTVCSPTRPNGAIGIQLPVTVFFFQ
ncbi:CBO0543 family protein [Geobacillus sp. DSP4a]|uniref:CBO0543 family protein n=1 Tax=Geobacillus sp. DSP4a TaxID=2508873 RepID=UPI000AAB1D81|nr:CBO0543 family protein [Geobacillus sp. DSP4a]STO12382.1 Uncharacterised protein [[Flavobacterium] thermophilum]